MQSRDVHINMMHFFNSFSPIMPRSLHWLLAFDFIVLGMSLKYLGPCDFIFKYIEDCEGMESKVTFTVTQRRYNRTTTVMDVDILSPYMIGDHLTVELKGSMKKEGGYKPGAFYLKDTMCKVLELMVGDILDDILKAAGVDECPLPPGEHKARNFYFDNKKFNVPQMFGEYKMEIFVFDGEVTDSCYVAYFDLVPKEE